MVDDVLEDETDGDSGGLGVFTNETDLQLVLQVLVTSGLPSSSTTIPLPWLESSECDRGEGVVVVVVVVAIVTFDR